MSFIQENEIHIHCHLKRKYTFVQFSDVHIVTTHPNATLEEQKKAAEHENAWHRVRKDFANYFHEPFLEEHQISSCACLEKLVAYTKQIHPDGLLMTGDILDYNSQANIDFLTNQLKEISFPYLIACGNHEEANIFDHLTNNQSDFSLLDMKEFKIISLNNSKKYFTKEQFDFLKEQAKEEKPIFLCMHIPIMTTNNASEMKKYDTYYIINQENCDEISRQMIAFLVQNPFIQHIFCGHTHGKGKSEFAPEKYQFCASSGLIGYVNKIMID